MFRDESTGDESYTIASPFQPTKGCSLDPLPTDLVKEYADDLVPLKTSIINESLQSGIVPAQLKQAIIVPILNRNLVLIQIF